MHSSGRFPCDETKCRNVGFVLVVAAVESDDLLAFIQIDFDQFSVASLDPNPMDARLALVEVDVGDKLVLLNAGGNVSQKIATIILIVEGVGR